MSIDFTIRKSLTDILGPEEYRDSILDANDQPISLNVPYGIAYPRSIEQVQEIVQLCASEKLTILPAGKYKNIWRRYLPVDYDIVLSTARLNQVVDYQVENLVFACQAGMTGYEIASITTPYKHLLSLDPPLFLESTIGSVVSRRVSGPARLAYGTPRDSVIGLKIVNSSGELVNAGARVVKNVSGYDLCKLYTGSYGSLGVIVETAFKLEPLPYQSSAFIIEMADWKVTESVIASVMDSELLPRSLETLNNEAANLLMGIEGFKPDRAYLVAIFDGTEEQIEYQKQSLLQIGDAHQTCFIGEFDCTWNKNFHQMLADLRVPKEGQFSVEFIGLSSDITALIIKMLQSLNKNEITVKIIASHGCGVAYFVFDSEWQSDFLHIIQIVAAAVPAKSGKSLKVYSRCKGLIQSYPGESIPGIPIMQDIKKALDPKGVFISALPGKK